MSESGGHDTEDPAVETGERTTAPQSPFGRRELAIGLAVFAVGVVVAFAVPLALA